MGTLAASSDAVAAWWRDAVVYEVYIRSFADADADGIGDIKGLRSRLPYLVELGVDALWVTPWYPSPMCDGGYDVADYRGIEPLFGTMQDALDLLADAHGRGLRVLLDLVPNHTSDRHPWFQEALAAAPGSDARDRYIFRPGHGERPPNNWRSQFGGPAWTRVPAAGGEASAWWYLHLFAPQQPDLNWSNAVVRREFEAILRYWFDRGVDGFRIDVANAMVKQEDLPDLGAAADEADHPYWDQPGVHEIFREWRAVADSYAQPRVFAAEAWVPSPERLARYVRPGELHTTFNFDFLTVAWLAAPLRAVIDQTLAAHAEVGASPTWVLACHDAARAVSRYARVQAPGPVRNLVDLLGRPADWALGQARARAAVLLMLALPGGAYVYQGEELGLAEVEDLPPAVLQDPIWERTGHRDPGRDGCRVPLPWSGTTPPFGFSPDGAVAEPWLPQPAAWAGVTVAAQRDDPASMLTLYRRALQLRRDHPALGDGTLRWLASAPDCLLFAREPGFACLVNLSDRPVALPDDASVLLSSQTLSHQTLPPDTAVWLALASARPTPDHLTKEVTGG